VNCGLVIEGMWAVEKDVPTLPYVLYTALPSSPDLSQYPDKLGSWESVVAILHFQTGQTSEALGFCKRTFKETESPLKTPKARGYEKYFKIDYSIYCDVLHVISEDADLSGVRVSATSN
jgi:hypothetical protein